MSSDEMHIYDFEIFKALVELEIKRIERYGKNSYFAIAFLYAPELANKFKSKTNQFSDLDVAFLIKDNIRSSDVISPVEEDFVFLFFPETNKDNAKIIINRLKEILGALEIIDGIAGYPEDGKDKNALFGKLVDEMNKKLVPPINIED